MAAKKFTIPSLTEIESSKRQEYKVKTLFDKHKTSPLKNKESSENTTKLDGPIVAKATGQQTSIAKEAYQSKVGASTPKNDGKQSGSSTIQSSKLIVSAAAKSSTAAPKTDGAAPKTMIVKSSNAGTSLTAGSSTTTGVSPNRPSKTSSLIVSTRQRGNPLLKHIRSVPWEFSDIVADYEMGTVMCALFLSLRYHNLNPNYIHERLKLLGRSYDLRVLLVQVDTKDPHHSLRELAKMCILADCTLLCAWSPEEAARYIETYKVFENKPPDMIMEKQEVDFTSRAQEVLTSGRKINRTDVLTLLSTFGSFENIVRAGEEEMSFCPGLGIHKAKRLNTLLHEPFLKAKKRKKAEESDPGNSADVATS